MVVRRRAASRGRRAETLPSDNSFGLGVPVAASGVENMAGRVGAVVV